MINYAPRAGSVPARVIAHLECLPPDSQLTAAVLADALDIEDTSIHSGVEYTVKHGLLARHKRNGLVYYSLGNGTPTREPADEDDDPIVQRVVPAAEATTAAGLVRKPRRQRSADAAQGAPESRTSLVDVPRWPGLDIDKTPAAVAAPAPALAPRVTTAPKPRAETASPPIAELPPPAAEFRCALWSDGRLHIETYPGNFLLLTKDETRELVKYLERMVEASE